MDPNTLWHFQELFKRINWIAEKLLQIEQDLEELKSKLPEDQERAATRIDRIEYNFEQLKVETLSGTLVIGLTQGVEGAISELDLGKAVQQDLEFGEKMQGKMGIRLLARFQQYLESDVNHEIDRTAAEFGVEVDPDLRAALIDDLKKQLEPMLMSYMKEFHLKEEDNPETERLITEKMVQNIKNGLRLYFERHGKENEA